ncbi:MAG TPA: hypothetical protein V6C72_09465 [Chroococcales cyanobacterium]
MLRSILQPFIYLEVAAEILTRQLKEQVKTATCDHYRAYVQGIAEEAIKDSEEINGLRADLAAIRIEVNNLKASRARAGANPSD